VERAREVLRHLIELSGLSQREVERRLVERGSGTDVTRLLSGRLDLKLRHVLDISTVLGIHPLEFFRMVFREPEQRSPFLRKLDELVAPGSGQRATRPQIGRLSPGDVEDLQASIAELLGELKKLSPGGRTRFRSRGPTASR
jgi:transcriptional regulator with XRE-family HTH domain